jgi:predicted Fe-Mo cluster-binding NifX family protein
MRVAVPTDDQISISAHTGRCAGFIIYSIDDHQAKREEYRANTAGHAHHQEHGEHTEAHHHHDHHGMIELLRDCDTVLAAGMGPRLISDLEATGIKVIFSYETDIAKAVDALAQGQLIKDQPQSRCCRH